MGRRDYPLSLVNFSSPPFKTVPYWWIFPLVFISVNGATWLCHGFHLFLVRHPSRQFVTATLGEIYVHKSFDLWAEFAYKLNQACFIDVHLAFILPNYASSMTCFTLPSHFVDVLPCTFSIFPRSLYIISYFKSRFVSFYLWLRPCLHGVGTPV